LKPGASEALTARGSAAVRTSFKLLSHPLTLLLVGALVTSVLVPRFTRQWQNRDKELDVKTTLVADISESVTDFVLAVQFAELASVSQSQADFDRAYRQWEVDSAAIESKLQAYFPRADIAEQWRRYSLLVTDFYRLSGVSDTAARRGLVRKFAAYFGENRFAGLVSRQDAAFAVAWTRLKASVLQRKDELTEAILNTSSALVE
jgi:hypothetical protein